ncbi:MAG TPA: 3-deoxy-D-manno-octulosonate 8-phosphate phosphatase [Acidobacteria bacterium]|nr:3-deoxy-D-manno-octulosonate 8-phosphate phosphatase [Acidobacteriota bacterium]
MPMTMQLPFPDLSRIRLLLVDVDGVLTDGGLYYFAEQDFALRFHVRDGLGLRRAVEAGIIGGVVSGRSSPQVRRRAEELGLEEIHLAVRDKGAVVREILERREIAGEQACFIGDDVVDLPAMALVGLPVAVADAVTEVRRAARLVTRASGGQGAVREVIDLLLAERRNADHPRESQP